MTSDRPDEELDQIPDEDAGQPTEGSAPDADAGLEGTVPEDAGLEDASPVRFSAEDFGPDAFDSVPDAPETPNVALADEGEAADWLVDFTLPDTSQAAATNVPISFSADIFDSPPDEVVDRLEDAADARQLGPSLSVGADASDDAEKPSRFADLDAAFAPLAAPERDASLDDDDDDQRAAGLGFGAAGLGVGAHGADDDLGMGEQDDDTPAGAGVNRRRALLTLALVALVGVVLFQMRDNGSGRREVAASDVPETIVDTPAADERPDVLPAPEFELATAAEASSVDFTDAAGAPTEASEDLVRSALERFGALSGTGKAGNAAVEKPSSGTRNKPVTSVPNSPTTQPPTTKPPATGAPTTGPTTAAPTTTVAPTSSTTTAPSTTTTSLTPYERHCSVPANAGSSQCAQYCSANPSTQGCPAPTTVPPTTSSTSSTTPPTTLVTGGGTSSTTTASTAPPPPPPTDPSPEEPTP